jgi:hypothetical protein
MSYLIRAIDYLKPGAEFVFTENDYASIQWHKLEGDAPSEKEIDAAIKQIKANDIAEAKKAEADKAAAQSKLAALGLTADDLKALGL